MGWIVIYSAVKRGGNWGNGANAGPFNANLNNAPTDTNNNIGFRCCNSSQGQIFLFTERKTEQENYSNPNPSRKAKY